MVLDIVQFSVFVVFCIAFGFIGFAMLRMGRTSDGPLENKLFLYAFIIRCVAAVLIFQALIYFHGIPFLSYGNDDFSYHQRAFELASEWATGDWFYPTYHAAAYDSMVAMIYLIFGPVPLAADDVLIDRLGSRRLLPLEAVLDSLRLLGSAPPAT